MVAPRPRALVISLTVAIVAGLPPDVAEAATSLTVTSSATSVTWGRTFQLSGVAAPIGTAEQLVVERRLGTGAWSPIGTPTSSAADGAWTLVVKPAQTASYRTRTGDSTVASNEVLVTVTPRLRVRVARNPVPYGGATLRASVTPKRYSGTLSVTVNGPGPTRRLRLWIRRGSARGTIPTDGAGRFRITARAAATSTYGAATAVGTTTAPGRTLHVGARGEDVRALMRHLRALGYLVPHAGSRYTFAASEVTLAFQKTNRLPRTYVWGRREWRAVNRMTRGPRPRFPTAGTHIEVDKSRQILMVVTDAVPVGIIAVSTGATGNTPVGHFRIYQRGGSHLYRFMGFLGNFGIHGYVPVPSFPASHGCVREPMWAAGWTWSRTRLGTPVRIYS